MKRKNLAASAQADEVTSRLEAFASEEGITFLELLRQIAALPTERLASAHTGKLTPEEEQAMLEADPDFGVCDRCGGDGMIEYNDGDGSDWGEDCPSEENHLITCRACEGTGKHR